MKHGDKEKGKVSQAGAKGRTSQSKGSEAKASSSKVEKRAAKAQAATTGKGSSGKAGVSRSAADNGSARPANGDASFGNPIIAAAFKRAAKKYSNAFRRLTD